MEIIETSIFTKQVTEYLTEDEYLAFQMDMIRRPDAGNVIKGSGGLRKIRWAYHKQGKSGGLRVIYYWFTAEKLILLLLMYPKNVQDNLTHTQLKLLRQIVEREFNHG
jgi:hypothetical protein